MIFILKCSEWSIAWERRVRASAVAVERALPCGGGCRSWKKNRSIRLNGQNSIRAIVRLHSSVRASSIWIKEISIWLFPFEKIWQWMSFKKKAYAALLSLIIESSFHVDEWAFVIQCSLPSSTNQKKILNTNEWSLFFRNIKEKSMGEELFTIFPT